MRIAALLLALSACATTPAELLTPDEFHLSHTDTDGRIAGAGDLYGRRYRGDSWTAGLTWNLASPCPDRLGLADHSPLGPRIEPAGPRFAPAAAQDPDPAPAEGEDTPSPSDLSEPDGGGVPFTLGMAFGPWGYAADSVLAAALAWLGVYLRRRKRGA